MPSNRLVLYCTLLLLLSIFPSIRVFSKELALRIRWPKYWGFGISPSNEYSGLISFRIDWFYLLAVQGTLNSFLQHQSSKASILRCSTFFMVQLSHLYMTIGKIIALTIQTFFGNVMSLFLNTLSRFVIDFFHQGASIFQFHGCMCPGGKLSLLNSKCSNSRTKVENLGMNISITNIIHLFLQLCPITYI